MPGSAGSLRTNRMSSTLMEGSTDGGGGSRGRPSRICSFLSQISVEPIITLSLMAMSVQSVVIQNLTQELICRSFFNHSESDCSDYVAVFNGTGVVKDIQATTADYTLYGLLIGTVPTVVLITFLGPWTDRHGRKWAMMLPLVGGAMSAVSFVFLVQMRNPIPQYVLLANTPAGVTGAQAMVIMTCYSYLSDTTTAKNRTLRVALADGALSVGIPVGTMVGSKIYVTWGYEAVFFASVVAYVSAIFVIACRVSNTSHLKNGHSQEPPGHPCADLFVLAHVKENVRVCTKRREGHLRAYVLLMLSCEFLNGLPQYGEFELMFIYCRKHFNWDVATFSYFQSFTTGMSVVGMFVVAPILSSVVKLEDAMLGLVGNIGRLIGSILKTVSSTGLILYIGGSMEVLSAVGFVVNRAILSKSVPDDELGKVFALDGIVQAVLPTFAGLVYTQIYKATLMTFPGAAFLVSVATTAIVSVIFGWIRYDKSNGTRPFIPI